MHCRKGGITTEVGTALNNTNHEKDYSNDIGSVDNHHPFGADCVNQHNATSRPQIVELLRDILRTPSHCTNMENAKSLTTLSFQDSSR